MMRDKIAAIIREVDGNHTMGAGELGENIAEALTDMIEPLVWVDFDGGGAKAAAWNRASYLIIRWSDNEFELVESYPGYQGNFIADPRHPTLKAAKAAADTHHRAAIMAAFGVAQ